MPKPKRREELDPNSVGRVFEKRTTRNMPHQEHIRELITTEFKNFTLELKDLK